MIKRIRSCWKRYRCKHTHIVKIDPQTVTDREWLKAVNYQRAFDVLVERCVALQLCVQELTKPRTEGCKWQPPTELQLEAMKLLSHLPNRWQPFKPANGGQGD